MIDTDGALDTFLADIQKTILQRLPSTETARCVKDNLEIAMQNESFYLDCLEHAFLSLDSWILHGRDPLLFDDDRLAFSVKIMAWPPGCQSYPHEHTHWTVTGVLHNELHFMTYVRGALGSLTLDREFHGLRGSAGFIASPCIHNVANTALGGSLSIHVFSGPRGVGQHASNGTMERGETTWISGARRDSTSLHRPTDLLQALLSLLLSIKSSRSFGLLDALTTVGPLPMRLASIKAFVQLDPLAACVRLERLADLCSASDRKRLLPIVEHIKEDHGGEGAICRH